MNLDDAQRKTVAEWITQGLKLSEIQNRLGSELGVKMTYMEVRLLADDLKLVPKDPDPPVPPAKLAGVASETVARPSGTTDAGGPRRGRVSVTVDQLARPGALISGKVTFSDGVTADWHMDQTGRLGLIAPQQGYRPPAADVPQFQEALDAELVKAGF